MLELIHFQNHFQGGGGKAEPRVGKCSPHPLKETCYRWYKFTANQSLAIIWIIKAINFILIKIIFIIMIVINFWILLNIKPKMNTQYHVE